MEVKEAVKVIDSYELKPDRDLYQAILTLRNYVERVLTDDGK